MKNIRRDIDITAQAGFHFVVSSASCEFSSTGEMTLMLLCLHYVSMLLLKLFSERHSWMLLLVGCVVVTFGVCQHVSRP